MAVQGMGGRTSPSTDRERRRGYLSQTATDERSSVEDLKQIKVVGQRRKPGRPARACTCGEDDRDKSIYHKNLMPVVYVTGDVAGQEESPLYAIMKMDRVLDQLKLPEGYGVERLVSHQPFSTLSMQ